MRKEREKPKITKFVEPPHIAFITKHPFLKHIADRIAERITPSIPEAGSPIAPYKVAAEGFFLSLTFLPVAIAGVILGIFISPIFFTMLPLPLFFLFLPELRIRSMIGDRKRGLEEELPFFAIHASIMQSSGLDVYNSLCSTIGRGVFKYIERDAAMVRRNVEFFGQGPLDAAEEMGRVNPSTRIRNFMLGYTSEWRSGGDMTRYLESEADDLLRDAEFRWRSYAGHATSWGELMIALFFMLPLVMLMIAFLAPEFGLSFGALAATILMPVSGMAILLSIRAVQPKTYDWLGGNLWIPAIVGLVLLLASLALGMPTWQSVALGLGGASALYGFTVWSQTREIAATEEALPRFLRDLTEYRKMGYDLVKAIIRCSEENEYNPAFDRLLGYVGKQLGLGRRMSEIEVPARSWMVRTAFFHLDQIAETGGGTPRTLELLTRFSGEVVRIKRETKQQMKLYRILSAFSPLGLGLVMGLMLWLLSKFSATFVGPAEIQPILGIAAVPPMLVGIGYAMIITAAVISALLSSVAIDFTPKSTLWLTLNLSMAGVGIWMGSIVGGVA